MRTRSRMQQQEGQCEWCSKSRSLRWHTTTNDNHKTICHCCYRTKRNGFTKCSGCLSRRFCTIEGSVSLCIICAKLNLPIEEQPINRSCVRCNTTKSMDWHTTIAGETVCLYCSDDDNEEVNRPKKKRRHKKRSVSINKEDDNDDDVEKAAFLLYNMLITINKI